MLRLVCLLFITLLLNSKNSKAEKKEEAQLKAIVLNYLDDNKTNLNLTETDISNWMISDYYSNSKTGITYVYVHQMVNGKRIFNAVSSVTVKEGKVLSFAKRFYSDAIHKINVNSPSLTPESAVIKTAEHLGLKVEGELKYLSARKELNRTYYKCNQLSDEEIRVELVYQSVNNSLILSWDVNMRLKDRSHWWNVRINATSGEYIQKNDWTSHCDFDVSENNVNSNSSVIQQPLSNQTSSLPVYRVFALPLESPNFGPSTLLTNPADPIASPYGWHDTNGITGAEYTITRGNNVYAYDDIANQNAPGTSPDGTASLNFDFPINFTQQPSTYLSASVTNLFYVNNAVHDILYHNGFDEASGNFQQNNYGNGGLGNDYVVAECQDGGGTNNANFSTPDDGMNGRMQMFLWTGSVQSSLVINSPGSIAANYICIPAGFGPTITTPITANFILVDDGNGTTTDACETIINTTALSGKIALIDRGICNFVDKVIQAQNAGAIAVVMINNSTGSPFAMGDNGTGGSVTIPSVMVSQADGNLYRNTITGGSTVNGTLNPPPSGSVSIDGSLDNGIVVHEFGHGVSNRLTGGPLNSNCLGNGEEGGEGWSDFFALMLSTRVGDLGTGSRGVGTFAQGQSSNGSGIRRYPYSTDMNIDPETYGFLAQSAEVHDIGEVWCTALWEMNWGLIDQFGFDPDWINGTSGNNIALKLVIEGLKLQPCSPGFLDSRDAILLADDNLYGGIHKCIIWTAFAKRGMGANAIQGSSDVAGDETENFSLPSQCLIATTSPTADFIADNTTTCLGIVHFTDHSINTPQQWNWNFGDGSNSSIQNPAHTYTTSGVFNVTLTVTNTIGVDSLVRSGYITVNFPPSPSISGDTTLCIGNSTVLTANITGGNVAEWKNLNDSLIFSGSVFNTPILNTSTTYKVVQYTPTPVQNAGPVNNTFGGGGYHNTTFEGRLLFTVIAPMRLISVWVDASGTASRTINLYQGVTIIKTISINIPNGQSRVNLNFDIPTPGNYSIGVVAGSNLYRNNAGASYPYTVAGLVSITNSNSTTNPSTFYYYLYNWEVQELPCTSVPLLINVNVSQGPLSSFTYSATGLTTQMTNTSNGNTVNWQWDFGNGATSALENPSVTYTTPGTYSVSLVVTDANGCQSGSNQLITVAFVGIEQLTSFEPGVFYSNHELIVKFNFPPANARIRVYDPIGKLLIDMRYNGGNTFTTSLKNIAAEFILIIVENGDQLKSKKITLVKN